MTDLASLNVSIDTNNPLFISAAPSPEFIIVDEESASTYPLLTPSPPIHRGYEHPLALENNRVLVYEKQLSPSSIDTDISSLHPINSTAITPSDFTILNSSSLTDKSTTENDPQSKSLMALNGLQSGMGSSSSSSSALQDMTAASAQLLNSHHYHNLASDTNCQENGGIKPTLCGIQLNIRKSPQDFYFVSWNWPLIRKFCFWGVMSIMVACVCIVIAYITTLPTRCDPPRSWYQGSLMYEVFPGSFKDSKEDGVGDLRGIASKVSYFSKLGVRSIRLNSIFPSKEYPEDFNIVENLTTIEPTLGTLEDFQYLVKSLHENNISLVLDIPLYPFYKEDLKPNIKSSGSRIGSNIMTHVIVNNHILNNLNRTANDKQFFKNQQEDVSNGVITKILQYWLLQNVDGFYMRNLENFILDADFIQQIMEWKSLLDNFHHGYDKILICSSKVIDELEKLNVNTDKAARILTVLTHFRLIDIYVNNINRLSESLSYFQKGIILSNPGYPWPLWTMGGVDKSRLASRLKSNNETLAAIALQMMLPGTPSIFYGDELGLDNVDDRNDELSDISHLHNLVPMKWSSNIDKTGKGFTQSRFLSWVPETKVHGPLNGPKAVSMLSEIRNNNPSIYMYAIWKDSSLNSNSAIRYFDENLILLERSYPRRNTYIIIANIGSEKAVKDLSSIFYGGNLALDHNANSGYYVTLHRLTLYPGEFYLLKLDK